MASRISQMAFDDLDAPHRGGAQGAGLLRRMRLRRRFFHFLRTFWMRCTSRVIPLAGYAVSRESGVEDLMRRSREGI